MTMSCTELCSSHLLEEYTDKEKGSRSAVRQNLYCVINHDTKDFTFYHFSVLFLLHFWASWSQPSKHVNNALDDIADNYQCSVIKVEAESHPSIALKYEVIAVPTVIFIKNKKLIDRVDGADIPKITEKIRSLSTLSTKSEPCDMQEKEVKSHMKTVTDRIEDILSSAPVVLFMKGTPNQPKCGFSRAICDILHNLNVKFFSFDVLTDEEIRQGIKSFSNWPTFPQLYAFKDLVGGLDIVKELHDSGELILMLTPANN